MSTLKVNYIQANTTSEIDINSPLGTIPSLDVTGSATIGGNLNITGVSTFTGNSYVAGSLGIGTASPGTKLHLIGNQYLQGGNYFTDTTSGYFWAGNGSFAGGIYGSNSGNVTTIISPQTINFVTSSTQRLSIDSSGRITAPFQPSCSVYLSTNQNITSSTWTQLNINTSRFNTGNNFNTSTYTFTAPVAGKYFISYTVNFALDTTIVNSGSYLYTAIKVNGAFYHYGQGFRNSVIWKNDSTLSAGQLVNLAANDTVNLWAYSDGNNVVASGSERSHLAVHLLG
ncbi:hypothetical protein PQC13_gp009 [Synechococcus phage S-SRM01]|uniref:C1q domain-containing protein n=1 Tax=Synechococcus phage S-SRM01 TaxID=2781608 RepID=A0A879R192_9CAUD|nr:hypothetical protein PQC13_gp009 [Synechococcus phage S-SRM01]QPX47974.1 hypothetical protein [Synechococcus phage S-SRM01]